MKIENKSLNRLKPQMVEGIIVRITLDGSFQRANLYRDNISNEKKKNFRNYLASELNSTLKNILSEGEYADKQHYTTIKNFSKKVSSEYKEILKDGKLRIGIAQKLINLYWKFSWVLKPNIKTPIHCPFDFVIIKRLGKSVETIAWTKFDEISDYKKLVTVAKQKSKDKNYTCIADWELVTYHLSVN